MVINRRSKYLPSRFDPVLCCILCGSEIPEHMVRDVLEEREDWTKRRRRGSLIVSATELEKTDFIKKPELWCFYFRTILDHPKEQHLRLSGIQNAVRWAWFPGPAPNDPDRARIGGIPMKENRWNTDFHMVNMLGEDWNREAGECIGYPMHVPCWLLLDRVIGQDLVKRNLEAFIQAIKEFWKANPSEWNTWLEHDPDYQDRDEGGGCYEEGVHWLMTSPYRPFANETHMQRYVREHCEGRRWHVPGSPLRIYDIQELIKRVTQPGPEKEIKNPQRMSASRTSLATLPLELALTIIETLYNSRPHCRERIEDIRNLLEASQWRLPNRYWQQRCQPQLVFEVDDLIKSKTIVDWAAFCLGLEELLLDVDWYCNSGLNNRKRTLDSLGGIKKRFLGLIE